ncbi:hypothetical protein D3C80_1466220 [compost metagenome]
MADHQHVQVLVDGVYRVRQRGVGGRGQNIRVRAGCDNIRRMAAARAFGMKRMDGATVNRGQRVLDKTRLVQRVAVQRHLNIHLLGDAQRAVDRRRRRTPVFVNFKTNGPRRDLLAQRVRIRAVAFAEQTNIHG